MPGKERMINKSLTSYLQTVFGMCGTASLEKQLKPVGDQHEMQPGDVFIKGGFPGHAMIVVDVAVNKTGNKDFYAGAELYAGPGYSYCEESID